MLIDELRQEIKGYNYETITGGDDAVAERCLDKAEVWLKAKLRTYGIGIDLDNPIIKEALIKRALYELYSYAENEEVARDKAKDAVELLRGAFGKSIEGEGEKARGEPVIYIAEGSDNWKGFK